MRVRSWPSVAVGRVDRIAGVAGRAPSLAPLLDNRRYIESIVAGIKIPAHPDFRFVTTMNDDASTYDIPEYIHSRLQPQIFTDFPEPEDERRILHENLPFVDDEIIDYVVGFLAKAHMADERFTARDGINVARYAFKIARHHGIGTEEALHKALMLILGDEALLYYGVD